MKVAALHNTDPKIRKNSSAGGVFTMLAEFVLSQKGVIYGAAFDDNWNVCHARVEDIKDLYRLRRSKYVYSYVGNSLESMLSDAKSNRMVLYSGTPCQIAAASKYISNYDNVLLVEVVCHGAPEPKYWKRYLNDLTKALNITREDITDINFRDKEFGWKNYCFSLTLKNGRKYYTKPGCNPYMKAFLKDYTLRQGCFKCQFKYPNGSRADITLGDFWGIGTLAKDIDNNEGTTLLIARTEKGQHMLQKLKADKYYCLDDIARYNPAIISPARKPLKYENFRKESDECADIIQLFNKYTTQSFSDLLKVKVRHILNLLKMKLRHMYIQIHH